MLESDLFQRFDVECDLPVSEFALKYSTCTATDWGACVAIALVGLPLRAAMTAALNANDIGLIPSTTTASSGKDISVIPPPPRPEHMPKMTLWQWLEMKLFRGLF